MPGMPYMKFYPADYRADTAHLSTEEHGAYLLLLMTLWQAGGTLPATDRALANVTRLSLKKWAAVKAVILPFFDIEDEAISHKRILRDLESCSKTSEERSRAGTRGFVAKSLKRNNPAQAIASDLLEQKPGNCGYISDIRIQTPLSLPSLTNPARAAGDRGGDFELLDLPPTAEAPKPGHVQAPYDPPASPMAEPGWSPDEIAWRDRTRRCLEAALIPVSFKSLRESVSTVRGWGQFGLDWEVAVYPLLASLAREQIDAGDPVRVLKFFTRRLEKAALEAHGRVVVPFPSPMAAPVSRDEQEARLAWVEHARTLRFLPSNRINPEGWGAHRPSSRPSPHFEAYREHYFARFGLTDRDRERDNVLRGLAGRFDGLIAIIRLQRSGKEDQRQLYAAPVSDALYEQAIGPWRIDRYSRFACDQRELELVTRHCEAVGLTELFRSEDETREAFLADWRATRRAG